MKVSFTHIEWLWLLPVALGWVAWFAWRSHATLAGWRRWVSAILRGVIVVLLVASLAGLQWHLKRDGMNVFFALDRSLSIPAAQQESAREVANVWAKNKKPRDKAGFLIFGTDAALETTATRAAEAEKIQAVVSGERTDIANAIALANLAFPEGGQKRIVLFSDGNENLGDAQAALADAKAQGVTLDVFPLGLARSADVSIQKLQLPPMVKKGQAFEAKLFTFSDQAQPATVRLYRDGRLLGQERVQLEAGRNLFTFPDRLEEPQFHRYEVQIDVAGDPISQNNRANGFVNVRGDPKAILVSADPARDRRLAQALAESRYEVKLVDLSGFPPSLAELQSYDAVLLSNISAGDLGRDAMLLLESAVRDFGVGLICIGGDNAYAAGGYRSTPLESMLPVEMELSSKKVLPNGALVMVMHGMEFNNGNQIAREIGIAALEALGPQDEMGVNLWDGTTRWVFELQKVGDKRKLARAIAGMNQGDMPSFQEPMEMGVAALKRSTANIKHMIVFSDGDPSPPPQALLNDAVTDKITISTVMIGGHVQPDAMMNIAQQGKGRFYDVQSPSQLPQIFIKEAAVILKSAIMEEPFSPQLAASTELVRGIGMAEYPRLEGYVATTPKGRAEVPLVTHKGDPLLAHWQYGLGRTVAFTSDAQSRWAQAWLSWPRYQQFWSQVLNWSLRRLDASDFNTEVVVENGEGLVTVEALDADGNYRNFLDLQVRAVSPRGEATTVMLEQKGAGRYEARFPTPEVGSYLLNVMEFKAGTLVGSQVVGASVNYSPEFNSTGPNMNLLKRLADLGGGQILSEADNPFQIHRVDTSRPIDLWEALLKWLVILFVLDVGVRRVDLDRDEWRRWMWRVRARLGFGDPGRAADANESFEALRARRDQVRSERTGPTVGKSPEATPRPELFRSAQAPAPMPEARGRSEGGVQPSAGAEASEAGPQPTGESGEGGSGASTVTGRLLDAKRRAKRGGR